MSKKMNFIWIDDDPARESMNKNLERHLRVSSDFVCLEKKEPIKKLNEVFREFASLSKVPDLIILDHKLTSAKGIIKAGSTIAEVMRERWKNVPIVCVTAADKDVAYHERMLYEDVFKDSDLTRKYLTIKAIANGFKELKEKRPKNMNGLLKLLKAPEEDINKLKAVIPDELKTHEPYKKKNLPISKWVRHALMKRPGFLYDQLWIATLLGVKSECFEKIRPLFNKAKYDGIFADESAERWWLSSVKAILFSKFRKEPEILPWILGRKLPDITPKDHCACYVCKKELPEIVGFIDEKTEERAPMHIRCSMTHPGFESALFFEEIKMMKQI